MLDISLNEKGTQLASSGNCNDVVLWTTDWKSNNCLKSYFDEEHENQIDTICFAPYSAARTLTVYLIQKRTNSSNPAVFEAAPTENEDENGKIIELTEEITEQREETKD